MGILVIPLLLVWVIGLGFLFIFDYFVPTFVAESRNKPHSKEIFWFNLLLGWTGIGWLIALVWAIRDHK